MIKKALQYTMACKNAETGFTTILVWAKWQFLHILLIVAIYDLNTTFFS